MSEQDQARQQQADLEMVDLDNTKSGPDGNTGGVAGGAGPGQTGPVDKGKAKMPAVDWGQASGSGVPPPVNTSASEYVTRADLELWGGNLTTALTTAVSVAKVGHSIKWARRSRSTSCWYRCGSA